MNTQPLSEPLVTIVVVPRERFSCTRESLESIYEHTRMSFRLVYVDGKSPAKVRRYLEEQSQDRRFELVRTPYFLSPNQARNIALGRVSTKYVVFFDNDVVADEGWLEPLLDCAEETGATAVGPLTCQSEPFHQTIHYAGGELGVRKEVVDGKACRYIFDKIYKQGCHVANERPQMQRHQTDLFEVHCVLIRTDIFDTIGELDEGILSTRDHVDLSMEIRRAGGTIYFEPRSLVTFIFDRPLKISDVPYFMLRWSDDWEVRSLRHLREKWNLTQDAYFSRREKSVGWRRRYFIIRPLSRKLTGYDRVPVLGKLLDGADRQLNRIITNRYERQAARFQQLRQHQSQRDRIQVPQF